MINHLFNQSSVNLLESYAGFTGKRHQVLADNVVNISTPGYRQKDLSESAFREQLRKRIESRDRTGATNVDGIDFPKVEPGRTLTFHDGNDRSVEQLMGDQAQNALKHNLAVELLRKQFALFQTALRERVA